MSPNLQLIKEGMTPESGGPLAAAYAEYRRLSEQVEEALRNEEELKKEADRLRRKASATPNPIVRRKLKDEIFEVNARASRAAPTASSRRRLLDAETRYYEFRQEASALELQMSQVHGDLRRRSEEKLRAIAGAPVQDPEPGKLIVVKFISSWHSVLGDGRSRMFNTGETAGFTLSETVELEAAGVAFRI